MNKLTSRFFLAAGLYVFGGAAAIMGLLLNYAIPKGGGGRGVTWLSLPRHDWADIHAFLALCFLAIAVAHAVVNRAQLLAHLRRILPDPAPRSTVMAIVLSPLALVIMAWVMTMVF